MEKYLSTFNLNDVQLLQLKHYYQLLNQANKQFNLTAITNYEEVVIKHFYDALNLLSFVDFKSPCLDLGSGAGIPGIMLKIACPTHHIILLEPTAKKAKFLQEVIEKMSLDNTLVLCERIENLNIEKKYACIVTRAVASLNILIELAVPYLEVDGKMYAYKGSNYQEEMKNAQKALCLLNATITSVYNYDLPNDLGQRAIIEITKEKATSREYPRDFAKIKKQPL